MNIQKYITTLIQLEPAIKQAGQLALQLRPKARARNKHQTGIRGIDIVTDADIAVQEAILAEMAKTKLVDCQLIAEEVTPSIVKFHGTNGLTLTIDPIDGTIGYVSDSDFFSIIICLRNQESLLYTLCHYPAVGWTKRITDKVEDFGEEPRVPVKDDLDLSHTIAHTFGDPEKTAPEICQKLKEQGYMFRSVKYITDQSGSCTLFFLNQVAGYYTENPNAYDGLSALHYGQVNGFKIYSALDIATVIEDAHSPHHPGWYVVLQN